jgi:UDP:flavonoid glycosyltransferase YjiC (YdhE family)
LKICFISCDNGLGHLVRLSFLANKFKNRKIVFYGKNKNFLDKKIKFNFKYKWYKKLNKTNFDLYISDNLPEVVALKKNSVISANFFWHRLFKINNFFYKKLEERMKKYNTKIFSNKYFYFPYLNKFNVKKIGFFGDFKRKKLLINNNVLISLGSEKTKTKIKFFNKFNEYFLNNSFKKYNFFLEKSDWKFLKKEKVNYYKSREKMMDKISLIIAKPGMGIITDALRRGIPILIYNKEKNIEFSHNAKILKKMKLGKQMNNLNKLDKYLEKIYKNKNFFSKIFKKCKSLKWNSENFLMKNLNLN